MLNKRFLVYNIKHTLVVGKYDEETEAKDFITLQCNPDDFLIKDLNTYDPPHLGHLKPYMIINDEESHNSDERKGFVRIDIAADEPVWLSDENYSTYLSHLQKIEDLLNKDRAPVKNEEELELDRHKFLEIKRSDFESEEVYKMIKREREILLKLVLEVEDSIFNVDSKLEKVIKEILSEDDETEDEELYGV